MDGLLGVGEGVCDEGVGEGTLLLSGVAPLLTAAEGGRDFVGVAEPACKK